MKIKVILDKWDLSYHVFMKWENKNMKYCSTLYCVCTLMLLPSTADTDIFDYINEWRTEYEQIR